MLILKKSTPDEQARQLKEIALNSLRKTPVSAAQADFNFKAFELAIEWTVKGEVASGDISVDVKIELDEYLQYIRDTRFAFQFVDDAVLRDKLMRAIISTFYIGGILNMSAANRALKHFRAQQSKVANIGKAQKRQRLREAIIAYSNEKRIRLAISEKFARSIRDDICERLGVDANLLGWPGFRTIQSVISDIRKG